MGSKMFWLTQKSVCIKFTYSSEKYIKYLFCQMVGILKELNSKLACGQLQKLA